MREPIETIRLASTTNSALPQFLGIHLVLSKELQVDAAPDPLQEVLDTLVLPAGALLLGVLIPLTAAAASGVWLLLLVCGRHDEKTEGKRHCIQKLSSENSFDNRENIQLTARGGARCDGNRCFS